MSKETYTPGPWKADFQKVAEIHAENGALVAKCNKLTSLTNLQANARLIAAAPDLLVAAQDLVEAHADTKGIDFAGWCAILSEKVDSLRAAISKATGAA